MTVTKWIEGWSLRQDAETTCHQTDPENATLAWKAFHSWLKANPLFTAEMLCERYPQVPVRIWFR